MKKDSSKVTFKGKRVTLLGEPVKPGDKAPDFTVTDKGLAPCTSGDFREKIKVIAVSLL